MEHHRPVCDAVVEYENWKVKRMERDDPRKELQAGRTRSDKTVWSVSYFIVLNNVFY